MGCASYRTSHHREQPVPPSCRPILLGPASWDALPGGGRGVGKKNLPLDSYNPWVKSSSWGEVGREKQHLQVSRCLTLQLQQGNSRA